MTCCVTYRSGIAGIYFIVPILISNVLTFSYMVFKGIGLNINSLPVAALGIGLGVDYSIYVVDCIKEYYQKSRNLHEAVYKGLEVAGRGVVNTATPLIVSTALWYFFSPMRFQAEMAILIAIWMGISAASALIVMPALVYVTKPRFVVDVETEAARNKSNTPGI
jgi:predicted RND superfamily exporter protein